MCRLSTQCCISSMMLSSPLPAALACHLGQLKFDRSTAVKGIDRVGEGGG